MATSSKDTKGEGDGRRKSPEGGAAGGRPEFIPENGFLKDIFLNQDLDLKYQCNHCEKILREPVQSLCGHRFCKTCFEKLCNSKAKGKVECPACKKEDEMDLESSFMRIDSMYPDIAVKREMNNLNTKCVNQGCSWTGQFKNYIVHERDCEFRGLPCPNCNKNIAEAKLKDHMENSCQKRKVKCRSCNAEMPFSESKEHGKVCPKEPMQCEACHKRVIREQYPKHQEEECTRRIIRCPAGCNDALRYDQFSTHIQKNIAGHMKYVLEGVDTLNKKIEEKVNALTAPNNIQELERAIEGLSRRIEAVENLGRSTESGASGGIASGDDIGLTSRMAATELRLNAFEPIMGVLHREIEKCIGIIEMVDKKQGGEGHSQEVFRKMEELETKIRTLDRALQTKEVALSQYELKFESLEYTRHDGILTWRINNFKQKRHDAVNGKTTSLYSPTFYTATNAGHVGYKMCARLYPNGDGMGKSTHISLFFVLMRGNFDNLLPWPFKEKVTLMMIDQNNKEHIQDTFKPDPTSSSFKKPETEMNIASGCPLFLPLKRLDDPNTAYVKDDVMFVKIMVDNSNSNKYLSLPNSFST